jgi:hypothetical protein
MRAGESFMSVPPSRRRFLAGTAVTAAAAVGLEFALAGKAMAATSTAPLSPDSWQGSWRWCNKCQSLAFAGNPTWGFCPAGGGHDYAGSGNYVLTVNDPSAPGQAFWMWCNKCQCLAFAGDPTSGPCAAGGVHDHAGSGNYSLVVNVMPQPGWQADWEWCNKCQCLAFAGDPTSGACAAGGVHDHAGSGNYQLGFTS